MKTIKFKTNILKYGLILSVLVSASSCSVDENRNINDRYGQTLEQQKQGLTFVLNPLKNLISNIIIVDPVWEYQLQQNLLGDIYSGYMAPPTPFAGDSNNSHYNLVDGWNQYPWTIAYERVMPNALKAEGRAAVLDFPQYEGLAKILRVEGMHRVSDIYGPIIYTQFGKNAAGDKFDTQKDAYYAFFVDLENGIAKLKEAKAKGYTIDVLADVTSYEGNIDKWIKFANSLRLRLAIRISNIDPAKAKIEGEKAIADDGGLLSSNADDLAVKAANPLGVISNSWGDIRMGASMESILNGYKDPRIAKYFEKSAINGNYAGIRQGIDIANNGGNAVYSKFSTITKSVTEHTQLMSSAEVQFLLAEASLRGWNTNGVTAENAYNKGIQLSFQQYGLDASTYTTNTTNLPSNYTDPNNAANNIAAVSKVNIAWNNGDSNAVKLEKIITQKWISVFPDGQEAWSEFRRTGYPKLFPVKLNKSGGTISTEKFIKRINFPASEKATNPTNVADAVGLLGGADNGGTNLWWDINK